MRPSFLFLIVIFLTGGLVSCTSSKPTTAPVTGIKPEGHRIVYDMAVGDTTLQTSFLRQLGNIKKGWPDAQVEVVVHGKALGMLVQGKTTKAADIQSLQANGVVFAACENTMRVQKVTKEQLLPSVITVPMGIGELVLKQEEGWNYIKF